MILLVKSVRGAVGRKGNANIFAVNLRSGTSNNFKVSIYINGYGYLIRLEGEVIKIASDFSPGNNALKKNPGS